jgi:hypothetical protein
MLVFNVLFGSRGLPMRISRWVGVVGAVVYVVGFFLVSAVPGGGDVEASDFEDFYVTDDNTALPLIGLFVLTIGTLALLWFFHNLRTAIGSTDAGFGWAAAALGLAVVLAGASLLAGPSAVQAFSDADFVGEPVAHALASAGFGAMLVPGSLALGLGVGVLSYGARRTAVLPQWAVIAGFVAAVLQLGAIIWIPSFAIPLWVLLASVASLGVTSRANTAT